MDVWEMSWGGGELEVQSLGGMLGRVAFRLPCGRLVSPLHEPPWSAEPEAAALPPLLRYFRGEWPCVPFGAARPVRGLTAEWRPVHWSESEGPPHGYASNAHWELVERSTSEITLQVAYPEQHPVRRLQRSIRPRPGEPGLDLQLEIETRANVRLPIGLHTVFRLSGRTGGTHLLPAAFQFGMTFPGDFEPGADLLAPGATFSSLQAVPTCGGGAIDFLRLPLERRRENLVQLCGVDGSFELYHEEDDYHVRLEWNAVQLPSCVLWVSNRGRADFPWNGRHVALGVEPINSAFDLGTNVSNARNPIRQRGISTSLELTADQIWSTTYALTVY